MKRLIAILSFIESAIEFVLMSLPLVAVVVIIWAAIVAEKSR